LLELLGIRSGDLGTSDSDGRGLEVVESVLCGKGENLCRNTEAWETGLDSHQVASLLDGFDNGLEIERLNGTEVDDLDVDTVFGLELLCGDERLADTAGESNDGKVLAGALNLGLSELSTRLVERLKKRDQGK